MRIVRRSDFGGLEIVKRPRTASARRHDVQTTLGSTPAQATFAALTTLEALCSSAAAAVEAAALGPYSDDGSCTYDCGFMEQDWNWKIDFTQQKAANLVPWIMGSGILAPFSAAYSPTSAWLSSLSQSGVAILASHDEIVGIDAAIKRAGGVATPAQLQQLGAAFEAIRAEASHSCGQLNAALQQVAGYLAWVQPSLGGVASSVANLQKEDDAQLATMRDDLISNLACGGGTVTDQFAAAQVCVDAAFATLQPPCLAVDSQSAAAMASADWLPGAEVLLQGDFALFQDDLGKARTEPPATPLRVMYLKLAMQTWNQLVADAQSDLAS